ncbi:hypothetical protein RJ639_041538 [Escallonia herrerae]|uniref:AP2/ERF domain-containing protein n=1 Tax=Escallonia herrerae TaxID=1293975 RepID=A0AA88WF63_9ASTE|nr:hypothetical protein RJ639_041538 [Escallonia herrerae]
MDVTTVKSELGLGSRRLCPVKGESSLAKCVKRRRRSPSLLTLNCNDPQGLQQQLQATLVDQPTATTTTVKRSSRFRGVSRTQLDENAHWKMTMFALTDIGGQGDMKLTYGIKDHGMRHKERRESKVSDYEKEVEIMQDVTKEEYLASLRRRSSGFSRGVSKYRGVARHHHNGRWEARIGRVFGNKYLYLGTYGTQEEAAHAYDIAAIEYRGINAVTNFDLSTYIRWLRSGANSLASQDPRTSSLPAQTSPNRVNPDEEPEFTFNTSSFTMGNLGNPQTRELLETKMPISPCSNSSAPTALGLLLRSSMFKELVEKNSSAADKDESEGNDTKKETQTSGGEDNFGGMFNYHHGISNVPYVSPSNANSLELKEENASPLFNPSRQSVWNGPLNMPSHR